MSTDTRVIITNARRKMARAKCYLYPGKGRIFVNGVPVELIPVEVIRMKIMEPMILAGEGITSKIDAKLYTNGGGVMGQADAARMALAKALVRFTGSPELKELYKQYDRTIIAGDPRQTEAEKWMRYSARRWRQKSYR
ncbi:30S ribosomal protein S9 [Metallosphaera hakonensis]|uniref:Small ribosomal subunit protein uS9 n=1 Tax=Metallosphaera hakonensis JCM 8857 = DSM 7519 TaxID=1293036 RepID=A0A2U9IU86_9CREN|nr:30S ribosomal protein S9 [Metallosphaera hakonensis]AWR99598.1 30S ribosomal protein S9 [Metallosphaera hakonensis JCM 8857 = DSM 7519]